MEKYKIKIIYKTENGTEFPTFQEALVADRLEKSALYLQNYILKDIVKLLCDQFYIKEKKDEIISTSEGS